ncbi:MAG: hypothetical protein KDK76_02205 [Chlamydiia bacterium]|nr:hypothetical protein [Chlamydiia bacterium]
MTQPQTNSDPFVDRAHVANFITEASVNWVSSIQGLMNVTAKLGNNVDIALDKLYQLEDSTLNRLISSMNHHINGDDTKVYKKWTKNSLSGNIQKAGMNLQVVQKEWDNFINQVQNTGQQQTSQISAQGNDTSQATQSAGLMAQLMQIIASLLQSAL